MTLLSALSPLTTLDVSSLDTEASSSTVAFLVGILGPLSSSLWFLSSMDANPAFNKLDDDVADGIPVFFVAVVVAGPAFGFGGCKKSCLACCTMIESRLRCSISDLPLIALLRLCILSFISSCIEIGFLASSTR